MNKKIEELTKLEDFEKVYSVFSRAPYFEKYTKEELKEIFEEYKRNGYIYGAYNGENCIGLIALERGKKDDQPVSFEEKKVMYLADVAVLEEYRKNGIGNQLMLYGVMQSKLLGYDVLYMRTLEKGSMSCNIARKIGFKQILNVSQKVERQRVNGKIETMNNIFLEIDLKALNREDILCAIQTVTSKNNKDKGER